MRCGQYKGTIRQVGQVRRVGGEVGEARRGFLNNQDTPAKKDLREEVRFVVAPASEG